ncbi:MAG: HAMP domain-containing sensor histidine kinase [Verrucomicrobiota bacterium JB023]|nr:HAMP domain-containing sensor histidine kinase [Verrucomicrobiota bacterium JB023]
MSIMFNFAKKKTSSPNGSPDLIDEANDHFPDQDEYLYELVRGLIHKHNNLLTITQGYANLLQVSETLEEARNHGRIIVEGAQKAVELNAKVMACAMQDQPKLAESDANFFLRGFAMKCQQAAEKAHLTFNSNLDEGQTTIHTDIAWVEEILTELLDNAVEAGISKPGSAISLRSQRIGAGDAARLLITLENEGKSPDEKTLEKAFVPFFTSKDRDHLGIGLTKAARYAQKLDIELSLDPTPQGAIASVAIPLTSS